MGLLNKDGGFSKIDKVLNPNANDVAKIKSDGQIENSGIQVDDIELNTKKTTSFQSTPDDDKYPTEKLVKDNLDLKADKITGGTDNNFVKQNANGNIVDSGVSGVSFNGANELVKLDSNGKLAAIDGSQLTNVSSSKPIGSLEFTIASNVTGAIAFDGSSRLKSDYSALYTLITAELGANALEDPSDSNNFILPDLAGRVIGVVGGGRSLFDLVGSDTHTLTVNELPAHKHDLTMIYHSSTGGGFNNGRIQLTDRTASTTPSPSEITMANTGGDQAHNIVQKTAYIAKKVFIYY
tara:strand:+ start:908 stop:1789 length:882 start_codon:yes stop_codon:yes gene_type:complete